MMQTYNVSQLPAVIVFSSQGWLRHCYKWGHYNCNYYSAALVAEGRHAEPHNYRTNALIFLWSSSSAAYSLRAPMYVWWGSCTRWCPSGQLMHAAWPTALILEIHFMINWQLSRYLLTSIKWPYRGLRLELVKVLCFLEVDGWAAYGFSLDRGLKYFYKLSEKAKKWSSAFRLGLIYILFLIIL